MRAPGKLTSTILFLFCIMLPTLANAEEQRLVSESPYFEIETAGINPEDFPLEKTEVDAEINGVIAKVTVKQKYTNKGDIAIDASYIFPASMHAAVHAMTMDLNGHIIKAKIKEKQQAQREFNQAKREGKSASLLKQKRPNVFSMDLANILPGDVVIIEMEYTEMLVPTDGTYSFIYPTVVGPRYAGESQGEAEAWLSNPYLAEGEEPLTSFAITTKINAGMPLNQVLCKTHETDITWQGRESATVSLKQNGEFAGNRDYILNYRLKGSAIETGLMLYEGEEENFFTLMMQPPERIDKAQITPREYIFVLDVSGSMHGFPLNTAKGVMKELLSDLRPHEKFNVVFFSGGSRKLSERSLTANKVNIQKALSMVDGSNAGGGTRLLSAMQNTLTIPKEEGFSRSVVIVTDGYISAEQRCFDYIKENLDKCNFFSFGIGSSVNRYLIDGIAKVGKGEPFVITSPAEAKTKARKFRKYIASPVLTDIGVDFYGFDAYDVEPVKQPDIFSDRPLLMYGKYKGRAKGKIGITGYSGTGPYEEVINLDTIKTEKKASALPYLWARKKIEQLSDFNSGEDVRDEVVSLGLKYNLLTKYTSFIAVHEEVRNTSGKSKKVTQPQPLPKGVSEHALGGSVHATPEPSFWLLLIGTVAILLLLQRKTAMDIEEIR